MLKQILKETETSLPIPTTHKQRLLNTLSTKHSFGLLKKWSAVALVPAFIFAAMILVKTPNGFLKTPTVNAAELLAHAAQVAFIPPPDKILSITRTLYTWNVETASLEQADVVQLKTDGHSSLLITGTDPTQSASSLFLETSGTIVGTEYEFDPEAQSLYSYPTVDATENNAYTNELATKNNLEKEVAIQQTNCGLEKDILVFHESPLKEVVYSPSTLQNVFDRVDQGSWCSKVDDCPTVTDPRDETTQPLFDSATVSLEDDGYLVSVSYLPSAVSLLLELNTESPVPEPLPVYTWKIWLNHSGVPVREAILKDGLEKQVITYNISTDSNDFSSLTLAGWKKLIGQEQTIVKDGVLPPGFNQEEEQQMINDKKQACERGEIPSSLSGGEAFPTIQIPE